jgi:adenine-specific DNA-methyltransferase
MDLSDSEKRDLIKLIESNKPLPDQYRFRIFEKSDEIELLWNGKNNEITNVNLPFQIIEQVDEPRKEIQPSLQGNLFDERGRKLRGWTNKLIWGNNSLVLSSLINGPLREEIEKQGGLKLVYIDPPFDVQDNFEFEIEIGKEKLSKKRNALEQLAFSDTWGKGEDSFLSMIYEKFKLISNLLANDGNLFLHCDSRLNSSLRIVLDEIFGAQNYRNEIIWKRSAGGKTTTRNLPKNVDYILWYSKSENYKYNVFFGKLSEENKKTYRFNDNDGRGLYRTQPIIKPSNPGPETLYTYIDNNGKDWLPPKTGWRFNKNRMKELENDNRLVFSSTISEKYYLNEREKIGQQLTTVWDDIVGSTVKYSEENLNYPTQKPEKLLERILLAMTDENDLVADFFCGSGTTLSVAEKLNRKWIGCDLGKFAIHTSRKRLINAQREREKEGKHFRPFEVLNLGKYQREFFIKDYLFNERALKNEQAEQHYYELILDAYKAKPIENLGVIKGIKNNRAIAVGPFNLQVTRLFVEEVIKECALKKITTVDILGFEFEMGLFPNIRDVAAKQGVDLNCLYIPNDIFDKKAVKKHQIIFYNTAYIDAQIITKKDEFSVKLKGYSVFDSDNQFEEALSELEKGEKREILMKNSIIRIHKDKDGKINKNIIKMKWDDWVDYWSVDFDFENKKEIIKEGNEDKWTGDFIFENEWQSFRTKETEIEFETPFRKIIKGKKIAVKVIDIFGNDTMKILEL